MTLTSSAPDDVLARAVVKAADLDRWLAKRDRGRVGPDFARTLAGELHDLAKSRDKASVKAGPVLRWLARSK